MASTEPRVQSKLPRRLLAISGMALALFGAVGNGRGVAQGIDNGVGAICDTPEQVEQLLALSGDTNRAVEQVNAQHQKQVCEILDIAFLVGGIATQASNDKGVWEIRRILVVGIYVGGQVRSVQPYEKYTAFLISKTSPI